MAKITLQGNPIETTGNLPTTGTPAPAFTLTKTDLADVSLSDYKDKTLILNIFPSIDTDVCATSVRTFNEKAAAQPDTTVLCISADLPFAHNRFCETQGIDNVTTLSCFRSPEFGEAYGVTITTGVLKGLLARAIVVIKNGIVTYSEQVPEIAQEPDYDKALQAVK